MRAESVSVVMACYAGDRLGPLREAVDSILDQTVGFLEFIVVVDGPVGDDIQCYLKRLEFEVKLVRVRWLPENIGVGKARNAAVRECRGDYIAVMDSDDISAPDRLELQLDALRAHGVDAVWGWQEEFYDGSNEYAGLKAAPEFHGDIAKSLKLRCLLPDPTTLAKRECFEKTGGYDERGALGTDYIFFLKMLLQGYRFYCVQKPLIKVRVSASQRKRRGGLSLLGSDFELRRWMYRNRLITLLDLVWLMGVHLVFRLQPNFLRDVVYRHVLRN